MARDQNGLPVNDAVIALSVGSIDHSSKISERRSQPASIAEGHVDVVPEVELDLPEARRPVMHVLTLVTHIFDRVLPFNCY